MSSTVQVGQMQVTSSDASAEEMLQSLTPPEKNDGSPKALVDRGQPVKPKDKDESKASEAARELGKRGGEAAAKARQLRIDEAEQRAEREMAKQAESEKDKGEEKAEAKEADEKETAEEKQRREGHPRHDPEARVRRATEQVAALKRELAQARAEAEERIARLERGERPAQAEAKPATDADPEPKADDFDSWEDWNRQHVRWLTRQEIRETQSKEREAAQRQQADDRHVEGVKKQLETFSTRVKEATEADPDALPELDEDGQPIPGTGKIDPELLRMKPTVLLRQGERPSAETALMDGVMRSEQPVQLLRYLTEHPEEKAHILGLPDWVSIVERCARIDARLEAAPAVRQEPAKPRSSSAPPPPRTVQTTTATPGDADLTGNIGLDAFVAKAGSRFQGRRGR